MAKTCEVCGAEVGTGGGTIGHVDSHVRLNFCKDHWGSPDHWKPICGVVFEPHIKERRSGFKPRTKKEAAEIEAREKVLARYGGTRTAAK